MHPVAKKEVVGSPNVVNESDQGYESGHEEDEEDLDDVEVESVEKLPIPLVDVKIEGENYSFTNGSPRKKVDEEKSDSSKNKVKVKHSEKPREDDRFYSDEDDDSPSGVVKEEEEEDDDDDKDGHENRAVEYERNPVTKPFDIKGLLQIKQKKSKLDLKLYQIPSSSS